MSFSSRMTRRQFAGAALSLAAARAATAKPKNIPIALQLYSLRNECKADLAGTLAAVAKMGYQGIEWFGWGGYFERSPKELRKLLAANKLKSASDHIHMSALQGDRFQKTIELHKALGTKLLTLSELVGNKAARATAKFWEDGVAQMKEAAERLKRHGIRLGLHNHTIEFVKVDDGRLPWDIVFDNTGKEIAQQLDLGSALAAGVDPAAYIRKYPGRTLTLHMKDHKAGKRQLLLGEGDVNWLEIFELAESAGGVQWYIVEQESYPFPPLESVEKSGANLRRLLAQRKT
jgi:sugar phosphate isomerase/epimerase